MLETKDIVFVESHFKVYDHNWEYYASLLGEPFLVNDCLVYYDGEILYICAFSLTNPQVPINLNEVLSNLASDKRFESAKVLDVWGNFIESDCDLYWKGFKLKLISHTPKNENVYDSIVNVENFDYSTNKKARLARNSTQNKQIYAKVIKREYLTYEHIKIIEMFLKTHDINQPHLSLFLSVQFILKLRNSFLIESFNKNNQLIGFTILVQPSTDSLVYLLACYNNTEKGAADCTLAKCIDYCKRNKIKNFHLGYSATNSLLSFKKKWGASSSGLTYEEKFYELTDNSSINMDYLKFNNHLWRDRMFMHFYKL